MTQKDPEPIQTLREQAEQMLRTSTTDVAEMSTCEIQKLVHDLQVHQMELEIQNEELRKAQVQLAHSRDRYSDLYEFAPVGYLTLNTNGVIEEANLTGSAMLGVERKGLIGRKFSDFIISDSQDTWHLHRRLVDTDEVAGDCELQMIRPDRKRTVYRLHSLAIRDEKGNVNQLRTAITDVSERNVAFETLRKLNIDLDESLSHRTEELDESIDRVWLLSEAVSHLSEGVLITSDGLNWPRPAIVFVNQAMCKMTGYSADELIGQSPQILLGTHGDSNSLSGMGTDLAEGGSCVIELRNYRKDGSSYDAEIFVTPLFDKRGHRTNFVSIHRDISERKRAENDLQDNEERLSMAFCATNDAIWDLFLINDSCWCNESYQNQFGIPTDGDAVQWWIGRIHPEDRDRVSKSFRSFVEGGGDTDRWSSEYRFRRIDGSYADVTDRALRACDKHGKPERIIGALIDVSDRRNLERQVLNIAAEEHRRIGSDLHDGLGQELTGLSMIANALVISLSRASRPEVTIAEKINAGIRRSLQQIRALSRGMNPVDIDAQGLMASLADMTEQLVQLYNVRCSFHCEQPVLLRDNQAATQLYRIAQEATTNAIRHGKATQIAISLEKQCDHAILRVTDDGVGLPEDGPVGTGLGLQTMRYRADIIGGTLKIAPAPKGGTEVTCTVPDCALKST